MNLQNAQTIKALLMDYVLADLPADAVIGVEVPFISGKRWADLLAISVTYTHAYEIKSALDSLDKLQHQTDDYLATFDYTTLVLDEAHLSASKSLVSPYVGLMVLKNGKILERVRPAKQRVRLKKENLISFMWRDDLLKTIRKKQQIKSGDIEIFDLKRKVAELFSTEDLRLLAIEALRNRYSPRYKNFLSERGQKTLVDDLTLLTTIQPEIRFD